MIRAALITPLWLAACGMGPVSGLGTGVAPDYRGIETTLLAGDLVRFEVAVAGAAGPNAASAYAECAAAQYTLIRGYGFARHLRTNVKEKGGVWTADAVYTVSPTLPHGLATIDAEVTVANCTENGIPTV